MCVSVYAMCIQVPKDVRRGHWILWAGDISGCELLNMSAKNQIWVPWNSSKYS